MSVTDELVASAEHYADGFSKGHLPMPPRRHVAVLTCMDARVMASPFIPHRDPVRGFVYEVKSGRLREVND